MHAIIYMPKKEVTEVLDLYIPGYLCRDLCFKVKTDTGSSIADTLAVKFPWESPTLSDNCSSIHSK